MFFLKHIIQRKIRLISMQNMSQPKVIGLAHCTRFDMKVDRFVS